MLLIVYSTRPTSQPPCPLLYSEIRLTLSSLCKDGNDLHDLIFLCWLYESLILWERQPLWPYTSTFTLCLSKVLKIVNLQLVLAFTVTLLTLWRTRHPLSHERRKIYECTNKELSRFWIIPVGTWIAASINTMTVSICNQTVKIGIYDKKESEKQRGNFAVFLCKLRFSKISIFYSVEVSTPACCKLSPGFKSRPGTWLGEDFSLSNSDDKIGQIQRNIMHFWCGFTTIQSQKTTSRKVCNFAQGKYAEHFCTTYLISKLKIKKVQNRLIFSTSPMSLTGFSVWIP